MKIKNDFVTNSSSCSYIVCIPDMEKFIKQIEERFELLEEFKKELLYPSEYINLDRLSTDEDEDDLLNFWKFHDVVDELGYVISFIEYGPDNEPKYINIGADGPYSRLKKLFGAKWNLSNLHFKLEQIINK